MQVIVAQLCAYLASFITGAASTTPFKLDSAQAVLSQLGVEDHLVSSLPGETQCGKAAQTCRVLEQVLPSITFSTHSLEYDGLTKGSWSRTCRQDPACIVVPENEDELSTTLKVLSILKTKFSVRGGGHTNNPGFSSIGDDGVLIALEDFQKLTISDDKQVLTVGSGNRWGEVYKYVSEQDVMVVGGRVPAVGVPGFLLGGGLSLFYNYYGLAADQVLRYRVALSCGEFVDATPTENEDLYKALKGGMANFGVVTEFDLQTNDYKDIYFAVQLYSPDNIPELLSAYATYLSDPEPDRKSVFQLEITATHALGFFGYMSHIDKPAAFSLFTEIPTMMTAIPPSNGTVAGLLVDLMGGHVQDPGSRYSASFAFKVSDGEFLRDSYKLYQAASAQLPEGVTLTYAPQGMTAGLSKAGSARNGGNVFGISEEPQVWADIFVEFQDVALAPRATAVVDDFVNALGASAEARGLDLPFRFPNNASPKQDPLSRYGEENLAFIRSVAAKFDPDQVMQKLQNGGFLLRDVEGKKKVVEERRRERNVQSEL